MALHLCPSASGLLGLLAVVGSLQSVPTVTAGAPDATLEAEFTSVAGVRELADGRLLISDFGERRLWVADLKDGSIGQVGREGQGPGEYQRPRSLFPLSGDSTLLVDALAARWLVLAGDSIVQTIGASAPPIQYGARLPLGVDARGFVVAWRPMGRPVGAAELPSRRDSVHLVRVHRRTGAADTLATIGSRPSRINITGPVDRPTRVEIIMNPLSAGDQTAVFPDGWIAVARFDPYAVDWIAPDGRVHRGVPLPFERHPVTDREKRAVLARQAAERGVTPAEPETIRDWPATLPPFLTTAVLPANDGRVWIRRTPRAGDSRTLYDIVSREGALVARLALGANEHVVGFGRGTVFVITTDGDGIQRLSRRAMPRF